jgi:hypothetical protein
MDASCTSLVPPIADEVVALPKEQFSRSVDGPVNQRRWPRRRVFAQSRQSWQCPSRLPAWRANAVSCRHAQRGPHDRGDRHGPSALRQARQRLSAPPAARVLMPNLSHSFRSPAGSRSSSSRAHVLGRGSLCVKSLKDVCVWHARPFPDQSALPRFALPKRHAAQRFASRNPCSGLATDLAFIPRTSGSVGSEFDAVPKTFRAVPDSAVSCCSNMRAGAAAKGTMSMMRAPWFRWSLVRAGFARPRVRTRCRNGWCLALARSEPGSHAQSPPPWRLRAAQHGRAGSERRESRYIPGTKLQLFFRMASRTGSRS